MLGAKKILIVEDDPDIAELIRFNLSLESFVPIVCHSAEDAYRVLESEDVALVLLDIMLPGMNGLEFCQKLRRNDQFRKLGIIMLTAKNQEEDLVRGLELGADDYISKPFSPQVLIARIKTLLRRSASEEAIANDRLKVHDIDIHLGRHEVYVDEQPIKLTQSEFLILEFLCRKPGWVFTRSQIVDAIRGENYAVTERAIDFQMVGLRKKMGDHAKLIETIRGVGYRMKEQ